LRHQFDGQARKKCLEVPPFRRGQAVESPVDLSFDRDAVAQQQGSDGREGVPPQADRSPGVVRFDRAEDALGDLPKAGTPTDGVELAGHVRRRPASPAKLPNPAQDLFDLRHLRLRRRGWGEEKLVRDDVAAGAKERRDAPQRRGRVGLMGEEEPAVGRVEGPEPPQLVARLRVDVRVDEPDLSAAAASSSVRRCSPMSFACVGW
jgi:hypothetical protein